MIVNLHPLSAKRKEVFPKFKAFWEKVVENINGRNHINSTKLNKKFFFSPPLKKKDKATEIKIIIKIDNLNQSGKKINLEKLKVLQEINIPPIIEGINKIKAPKIIILSASFKEKHLSIFPELKNTKPVARIEYKTVNMVAKPIKIITKILTSLIITSSKIKSLE